MTFYVSKPDPPGRGKQLKPWLDELHPITDVVLAYRPKPKTKAAKRRIRRKRRQSKKRESSI